MEKCSAGKTIPYKNRFGVYNVLYKTTCLVNGKVFVGVHSTTRLDDGYIGCGISCNCEWTINANYRDKSRESLGKYILKYGVTSFIREDLLFFDDIEQALFQERRVVDRLWLQDTRTLNIKFGGSKPPVRVGILNGNYGNKWTGEKKKRLSELKKQSGRYVGSKNPNAKPVIVIDICTLQKFEFDSSYDACKQLTPNTKLPSLLKALSQRRIYSRRFLVFRRNEYPEDIEVVKKTILHAIEGSLYLKYFIKNRVWS